jgi:hypothetical protein
MMTKPTDILCRRSLLTLLGLAGVALPVLAVSGTAWASNDPDHDGDGNEADDDHDGDGKRKRRKKHG